MGMYNMSDVYENVTAYFNPRMSNEERELLKELEREVKVQAYNWLPNHYKWLDNWKSDSPEDQGVDDSA
jgi:hypothetical protein